MNLPNKLTISRIILAGIFILFLFIKGPGAKFIALALFLTACVTDYYDGYLARKNSMITDFGRFMDPIADKVLILSAFLAFVELRIVPAWMVMVIITREFIITGIRFLALSKKKVLAAEIAGKHKTISQIVSVLFILIFLIIKESGFTFRYVHHYRSFIYVLMSITVLMTLVSGVSYMIKNRDIFTRER